jgi:cytochrome c-type biogenesis protein CcmH/NrfG
MPSTHQRSGQLIPDRVALIHREMLQLAALAIVAVVAFFLTRAVARNNRETSLRTAAEWYRRGEQGLETGRIDAAITAFRRATVKGGNNKVYSLALARSLTIQGDRDSARTILLTLRETAPEDASINLQLARLARDRQDVTEALRFYHDALYAPWSPDAAEARRRVRLELIQFLLTHGQTNDAQSELLAASADSPDDVTHLVELADLFGSAGDQNGALSHFQRALRLAPDNDDALAGAGQAAFHLARYALAQRYLHQTRSDAAPVHSTRETVDLILSRDPLASRIGTTERKRRLSENVSYADQRFAACLAQSSSAPSADEVILQNDLGALATRLTTAKPIDQDDIEAGADLIDRVERIVVEHCKPATTTDQALLLIGRQHGGESR